jgi:hypothetical protein
MSSIATIVGALRTTLTVSGVDQASTDEYLPPIQTANTALIIPAMGMRSQFGTYNFEDTSNYQVHFIRCEYWVKHTGNNASLTQRARAVLAAGVRALFDNTTLSGAVDTVGAWNGSGFDVSIEASISEQLIEVGGAAFLVATLIVPVTDFSLP